MDTRGEHEISFEHIRTPGVRHEKRDASFRAVMSFAIGLLIAAGVVHLVLWGMLKYFDERRVAQQPASHPMAQVQPELPPEPRLQPDPVLDMNRFRASEETILNSYTWADEQHAAVRMPIARAKQELLSRGLPVSSSSGATGRQAAGPGSAAASGGSVKPAAAPKK